MDQHQAQIQNLRKQMLQFEAKQLEATQELAELKAQLNFLLGETATPPPEHEASHTKDEIKPLATQVEKQAAIFKPQALHENRNLESFIGENLLSKIGIVITIIGVSIGVKYSIEKDLLPPVLRIALGYLFGGGLLSTGLFLKKKYSSYSAVLVSGAMAIFYFTTFVAFSFYGVFSISVAFILMVSFTALTVFWALRYNTVIIAHIGLIGGYAVPFLLSTGSGKVHILLAYMAIINSGILFISFKKYWKSIFYVSFLLTWIILGGWLVSAFKVETDFLLTTIYLTFFFLLFYACALGYKAKSKEKFNGGDVFLLLSNSFIFYGLGLYVLNAQNLNASFFGAFTLTNALLHGIISSLLWRLGKVDKRLLQFLSGLAVTYITITIPVYFNANWVTLLWAAEACLLFYIGASSSQRTYKKLSYLLLLLAFVSLVQDWLNGYGSLFFGNFNQKFTPIFNVYFLSTLLVASFFGVIVFFQKRYLKVAKNNTPITNIFVWITPLLFLLVLYIGFFLEIDLKWDVFKSQQAVQHFYTIQSGQRLSLLSFGLTFISVLFFVNIKFLKNHSLAAFTCISALAQVAIFLILGHSASLQLLQNHLSGNAFFGALTIGFRYIVLSLVLLTLTLFQIQANQKDSGASFLSIWQTIFHILVVFLLSSELVFWLEYNQVQNTLKLGLSILWGAYSLLLIAIGITKNIKLLRVLSMVLFAVTLVKLFAYDLNSYNTISKTIVFVSLGVLLLIISFLYNKNKGFLGNGEE